MGQLRPGWAGRRPQQYLYAAANPIGLRDPGGTDPKPASADSKTGNTLAPSVGTEIAVSHPKGFTLALPDNFDRAKIRAYRERINDYSDRAVGIRSRPSSARSATADIRRASTPLRNAYARSLDGGLPPGHDVDHTVELQNIIHRNAAAPGSDTVRPQDHRLQPSGVNRSQGASNKAVVNRQIANGAPVDTPAGGAAREKDVNKLWNREGGLAAKSATLLNAGRVLGAPAAVVGAGLIGVCIGTHLYEHHVNKELSYDAGAWVRAKTGSQVLGGVAAAGTAIGSAAYHAPGAAVEYASDTWTLNPSNVDWDRTLKPWKW